MIGFGGLELAGSNADNVVKFGEMPCFDHTICFVEDKVVNFSDLSSKIIILSE